MRESLALWAISCVIGFGSAPIARAESAHRARIDLGSDESTRHNSGPPVPLRLSGSLYFVHAADAGWSPGLDATGLILLGPLELGLSASGKTQALGYSRAGVAAVAGLRLRVDDVELDVAGTLGLAAIHTRFDAILGDDPGASGGVEVVGWRGSVSWLPLTADHGCTRAGFALFASYDVDLNPYVVTYSYTETSWLSDEVSERTAMATIGTKRFALHAAIVVGFD
jgi:hypothetical protein